MRSATRETGFLVLVGGDYTTSHTACPSPSINRG